jgi:hypothetical protein
MPEHFSMQKNLLPEPHHPDITFKYDEVLGSMVVPALSFTPCFLPSN